MNILIGNSGNKIKVEFAPEYDIQIVRKIELYGLNIYKYMIKIFLQCPYKICICNLNIFTIRENTQQNSFRCYRLNNKFYIRPHAIQISTPEQINASIPISENAAKLMHKKIDEISFMIKRDIVIMMRYGSTFEFLPGDTFDSLFGHIP